MLSESCCASRNVVWREHTEIPWWLVGWLFGLSVRKVVEQTTSTVSENSAVPDIPLVEKRRSFTSYVTGALP